MTSRTVEVSTTISSEWYLMRASSYSPRPTASGLVRSPPPAGLLSRVEHPQRHHLGKRTGVLTVVHVLLHLLWGRWVGSRPGRCRGGLGARRDPLLPFGRLADPLSVLGGTAVGALQQRGDRLRDLRFGGLPALCGKVLTGVVPGQFTERGGNAVQVFPGGGDPAALAVVTYPDLADVVGVVVDLPQVLLRAHP